jgi:hypothetical protein
LSVRKVANGRCRKRTGSRAKEMFIINVSIISGMLLQIADALGEIA